MEAPTTRRFPKPNNTFCVPADSRLAFFKWWCVFLRPFVNLTDREIDVVASFLKQREELSKSISDPAILDRMLMSEDTRLKVQEECNITSQYLYVIISNLRKHNIIENNTLNPKIIPNVRETDNGCFKLLILFKENDKR